MGNMTNLTEAQKRAKLIIDPPSELCFRGPFDKHVGTQLKLTNPSEEKIVFKIKTTAPKHYCVRPNVGTVGPKETITIEIYLQPIKCDPYERSKHKFLIQSVVCPEDEEEQMNIFKDLPADRLMDAKLRCVFEIPGGENEDLPEIVKVINTALKPTKVKEKVSNVETSEQTELLVNELRQLSDENTNLRKEILNLKEQVLKVRSTSKPTMGEPYTPVMVEQQIPLFYIAIAIAAAIFGVIIGKFIF